MPKIEPPEMVALAPTLTAILPVPWLFPKAAMPYCPPETEVPAPSFTVTSPLP